MDEAQKRRWGVTRDELKAVTDHTGHCRPVVLKVWSLDQQYQHLPGLVRDTNYRPAPQLSESRSSGVGPSDLCFNKTPGVPDSVAAQVRDPGLEAVVRPLDFILREMGSH